MASVLVRIFKKENCMKKVIFTVAAVILASSVYAGEIINKDNVDYKFKIVNGNSTSELRVSRHSSTGNSGVKKGTVIKMENGTAFKVDFDGDVVMENGKLRKK